MTRCDQCHIDGGVKVGKVNRLSGEAEFEIRIMGAKMNVCADHRDKFERMCNREKVEFKYHELKGGNP